MFKPETVIYNRQTRLNGYEINLVKCISLDDKFNLRLWIPSKKKKRGLPKYNYVIYVRPLESEDHNIGIRLLSKKQANLMYQLCIGIIERNPTKNRDELMQLIYDNVDYKFVGNKDNFLGWGDIEEEIERMNALQKLLGGIF